MKKIETKNLSGNEILGRQISNSSDIVLISKGTILKREYIKRLEELGIESVYVEENNIATANEFVEILNDEFREQSRSEVKSILEKHIYKHSAELIELCSIAVNIIDSILADDKLIEQLANIKQESLDIYTHSINVCAFSTLLALKLNINRNITIDIAKGSILHDIGLRYLTIPYENIDVYALDERTQSEYKKHVIYGYEAVKDENWLSDLSKKIILHHHENENGLGYPFKLKADRIRKEIKIVTICDAFDSLICGIGFKQAKVHEAVEFLKVNIDNRFNKTLRDQLLKLIAMYPIGSKVITNEGELGIVVGQNNEFTDRPIIRIIKDRNGNKPEYHKEINLIEILNVFIVDCV